jgi:hypothetical protein
MGLLYLYSNQKVSSQEKQINSAVRTSNPLILTGKLCLSYEEANIHEKEDKKYQEDRENFIIRRFMI